MINEISERLLSSLPKQGSRQVGLFETDPILKELWSKLIQDYGLSNVQKTLPKCLQKKAFFILSKVDNNIGAINSLGFSLSEVFTDANIKYAVTELRGLIHFNNSDFKSASQLFQTIPLEMLYHHRECLLSIIFSSSQHNIQSTKNFEDVEEYLDERLRMNVDVNTSKIEMENVKVYYRITEFNFGKHKGKKVGSLDIPLEYLLWCLLNVSFFTIDYSFLNHIVQTNPFLLNDLAIEVAIYKTELAQMHEQSQFEEGMQAASDELWEEEINNEQIDLISGGSVDPDDFDGDWDRLYAESGHD